VLVLAPLLTIRFAFSTACLTGVCLGPFFTLDGAGMVDLLDVITAFVVVLPVLFQGRTLTLAMKIRNRLCVGKRG
jgi:hypothetical protein